MEWFGSLVKIKSERLRSELSVAKLITRRFSSKWPCQHIGVKKKRLSLLVSGVMTLFKLNSKGAEGIARSIER